MVYHVHISIMYRFSLVHWFILVYILVFLIFLAKEFSVSFSSTICDPSAFRSLLRIFHIFAVFPVQNRICSCICIFHTQQLFINVFLVFVDIGRTSSEQPKRFTPFSKKNRFFVTESDGFSGNDRSKISLL